MFKIEIDKKKKYFFLGLSVLLVVGIAYRMWPQLNGIRGSGNEIELKKKQLLKYQQAFRNSGDLEKEVNVLKGSLENGESGLLTGKTPALAAADIQNVMREMAEKSQVEIKRVRVLKPEEVTGNDYLSIPVQLNINGNVKHLKEFLYQIAASSKYLTVKRVVITVHRRRLRRGTQGPAESVSADVTVNGFLKKSEQQNSSRKAS